MNKNQLLIFMLFSPVLENIISFQFLQITLMDIKFEVIVILSIIALLLIIRIITLIYFCVSVINWISSGFKLVKVLQCLLSFISIFYIDYFVKAILNSYIKRTKNKIQRVLNCIVLSNKQALQNIHL